MGRNACCIKADAIGSSQGWQKGGLKGGDAYGSGGAIAAGGGMVSVVVNVSQYAFAGPMTRLTVAQIKSIRFV